MKIAGPVLNCMLIVASGCSDAMPTPMSLTVDMTMGANVDMPLPSVDLAPEAPCHSDKECAAMPGRVQCSLHGGTCMARGFPIGSGAGTPDTVTLTVAFDEKSMRQPTGIGFNPARPSELWIVGRG